MKQKLLELLGSGISQEAAANAVGCTPAYISQLMADEEFRASVVTRRVAALQAATERDGEYDSLEDELLAKLKKSLPLIIKPGEVLRAIQVINAAKRRGVAAADHAPQGGVNLVRLNLPKQLTIQFTMNATKEVVQVEGRELITMPSKQLLNIATIDNVVPTEQLQPQHLQLQPKLESSRVPAITLDDL